MERKIKPQEITLKFMILCCKIHLDAEDKKDLNRYIYSKEIQIKLLILLSHRHAVLPQVYRTLKTYFPSHPMTLSFKPYYLKVVQKNISMGHSLCEVLKLFKKHHIEVLSIKGIALSAQVYYDTTLRQFGDLDFLILKKDKNKFYELLLEHHYIPEITLTPQMQKYFLNAANVLGFTTPSSSFIEIHWELLSKNYAIMLEEPMLWEETALTHIYHTPVRTLNLDNQLLYLSMHGSKHMYSKLLWVSDIAHIVTHHKDICWKKIIQKAKNLGCHRMLLLSLSLAQTLLGLKLPSDIARHITKDKHVEHLQKTCLKLHYTKTQSSKKSIRSFQFLLRLRERKSDKIRFVIYALFLPKFNDFQTLNLSKHFTFLYPILRPLRLMLKYFR
jgi:hypothetical protein